MNNIYVDELPKCCELCQMNCSKKHNFISCLITDCNGCIGGRPKGCPLKKLSDRLAEERKKVIERIRDLAEIYTEPSAKGFDFETYILTEENLNKILDKADRGNYE